MGEMSSEGANAGAGIDLSQFYQVFFEEAGENLDRMEQQLLEIECPPHVKTALLLAWKTASRMDEIARLEKDSIVESTPEMIVVNFSDRTKKSRGKPFLPENMCVVTGDLTRMLHESLPAAMGNWPTRAELSRYLPHPFTDHSIKHGAAIVLMEAAAENKFDKELVSLVLKHQDKRAITQTTITYCGGRLDRLLRDLNVRSIGRFHRS